MPSEDELKSQLERLTYELAKRRRLHSRLGGYIGVGESPIPWSVTEARLTKAYRFLMPMSEAAWGSLVVDSVLDRLELTGIHSDDEIADERLWGVWQTNGMDAESKLAHSAALTDGRVFALVWPGPDGEPEISLDNAAQMVVEYREGSRRDRVAALRRWVDGDRVYVTLYRPDGIYKFEADTGLGAEGETNWRRREVSGEQWPLPNPLGVVPVVELAVNRRLEPGCFGAARGEFEHATGLIDRINLLTFLGLVVAFWMGFPLRGVIGEQIIRDDDGNVLPPFDSHADAVFQMENPEAKIVEYSTADRRNLAVFAELDQLAVLTKTPRHYFPLEQGMSNLSADAIRASEGALHAKVTSHKANLGEGWEEVLRLAGTMLDDPVELSPRAASEWADHESRSLAERADAASKLKDILPAYAVAELALNASQEQIARWQGQAAMGPLGELMTATNGVGAN